MKISLKNWFPCTYVKKKVLFTKNVEFTLRALAAMGG